jgi:alpha,alpha-trehalose phosphorylase
MIGHSAYTVEPWAVRETHLDLDVLAQSESVFALGNGHIGLRANLDEGEPHGLPGTYLNSFYDLRPLPYAEQSFGNPESSQTVVNVTNGKLIRLLVEDEPFDVRYGELRFHERVLDLRAGVLSRVVEWVSPSGCAVRVTSTRLVSFTQRAVAAIEYEVEVLSLGQARVVVQSELVANEEMPAATSDPRAAGGVQAPLRAQIHADRELRAELVHSTSRSGLRVAAAMDHAISGPAGPGSDGVASFAESEPDLGRVTVTAVLRTGQKLRLVKYLAYGWSEQRSLPALRDQVLAALSAARQTGWDGLLAEQRAYLDGFWSSSDVELDGDTEIQQAVRFGLFHVLQAGARGERRAIAAKGLTGPGYDGHAFWDTEGYVLPLLTYMLPTAAADALRWRHATLPMARARARQLGLAGAAFPWRTIHGEECSGYWPAGTAAFHIAGDIADAVMRYVSATGDDEFERTIGLELLVETARLWRSLGHHDRAGSFRIDGVTGPDEYSAVADNNVFTNLMAQRNLIGAAEAAVRHPESARSLGVGAEEMADWRDAATAMYVPYDSDLGVHSQSEGFTRHEIWDFEATPPENYPLLLHYPYFALYRKQVVKQADLVFAMVRCSDAFTAEEKSRNFAYYERLTVRDSSLSACSQAVIAAEVGQLSLAQDYLGEAALMDLEDLENNTRDGLHIASLAGAWIALVVGFGGMRDTGEHLAFAPRLPEGLTRLAFNLLVRGRRLRVEIRPDHATYLLDDSEPMTVTHHGQWVELTPGQPARIPVPPTTLLVEPLRQPPGREPRRHRPIAGVSE